jgi:multiple sugar transport system substrate-binding protein
MKRRMVCLSLVTLIGVGLFSSMALGAVNWKQLQGTEIRFLMNKHPFTTFIEPKVPEFEKLTGIKVTIEAFPEDQYRNKRTIDSMPEARWMAT